MKIRIGTFNLFQFVEPPFSWYTKKEKFIPVEWEEKTTWIKNQIEKMNCDIQGILSQDVNTEFIDNSGLIDLICSLEMLYDKVDGENNGDYKLGNEISKKEFEELMDSIIKEQK